MRKRVVLRSIPGASICCQCCTPAEWSGRSKLPGRTSRQSRGNSRAPDDGKATGTAPPRLGPIAAALSAKRTSENQCRPPGSPIFESVFVNRVSQFPKGCVLASPSPVLGSPLSRRANLRSAQTKLGAGPGLVDYRQDAETHHSLLVLHKST